MCSDQSKKKKDWLSHVSKLYLALCKILHLGQINLAEALLCQEGLLLISNLRLVFWGFGNRNVNLADVVSILRVWNSATIKHYLFVIRILILFPLFKKFLRSNFDGLKLIYGLDQELFPLNSFSQRNIMFRKHVIVLPLKRRALYQIDFYS